MDEAKLARHRAVQNVAKSVLAALGPTIGPDDTERTVAERAAAMLAASGIAETWYYSRPALVLLGSRSCLSISGKDYRPAAEPVGAWNLVTVDLSPLRDGVCGDCARSFCIENGRWTPEPMRPEFRLGLEIERELHREMRAFVRPATSFATLYDFAAARIHERGFENLDFLGNVGHGVDVNRAKRRYIQPGNDEPLAAAELFTFEPHVRAVGSGWGFKHENIYYFDEQGRCREL